MTTSKKKRGNNKEKKKEKYVNGIPPIPDDHFLQRAAPQSVPTTPRDTKLIKVYIKPCNNIEVSVLCQVPIHHKPRDLTSVIDLVKKGSELTSIFLTNFFDEEYHIRDNREDQEWLLKLGLLDIVLGFLGRCCNEDFGSIINGIRIKNGHAMGGGYLESPSTWIDILVSVSTYSENSHAQIIDSIGPLVKCMCNDTKRKFFSSNRHWHESILPFAALIENLLSYEGNFIKLSKYEGLFESVAQWWFWKSYRPDIANEAESYHILTENDSDDVISHMDISPEEVQSFIISTLLQFVFLFFMVLSRGVLFVYSSAMGGGTWKEYKELSKGIKQWFKPRQNFVGKSYDFLSAGETITCMSNVGEEIVFHLIRCVRGSSDAKTWLEKLGAVPIVSRAYDPNCKVSLVGGIVRHINKYGDSSYLSLLDDLIGYADCVDGDVISEMISLAFDFGTSGYTSTDAEHIVKVISSMIMQSVEVGTKQPSDTRVSYAIRVGLLGMCMQLITRFGGDESICSSINSMLHNVYLLSFHKKTSKSLSDKRDEIVGNLQYLEQRLADGGEDSHRAPQRERALCIIQLIINISSTSCSYCNKTTNRKDMKKCGACKRTCYCSDECQSNDWHVGHDQNCKSFINREHIMRIPQELVGDKAPDLIKLKDLESNMIMTQKRLFLEHADDIHHQLRALKLPRSECITLFDLRMCLLTPIVVNKNDYFISQDEKEKVKELQLQMDENSIVCVISSPLFIGKSIPQNLVIGSLFECYQTQS